MDRERYVRGYVCCFFCVFFKGPTNKSVENREKRLLGARNYIEQHFREIKNKLFFLRTRIGTFQGARRCIDYKRTSPFSNFKSN